MMNEDWGVLIFVAILLVAIFCDDDDTPRPRGYRRRRVR